MKFNRFFSLCAGLALAVVLWSCGPEPSGKAPADQTTGKQQRGASANETSSSGNIYIAADETFQPVVEDLIFAFEEAFPDAHINVLYLPGEEAIKAMVSSDTIRAVICTRDLRKTEKQELRDQATSDKPAAIATDAIALVINPENKDSVLSQAQIKAILSGEISSWKEINPKSPLDEINLVFDHGKSSTVQYLRDGVLAGNEMTPAHVFAAGNNPAVIEYVGKNKNALGVIGIAWVSDSDSQQAVGFMREITVCKLENPKPCDYPADFHQPYQGLIKLGCYPFTRTVYIISRETRWGLASGFINYLTSQDRGQRLILKSGLVPAYGVPRLVQFPEKEKQ